jgi:hypothetical protein
MLTPGAHRRRQRAGFSLVLALVVTALLVLAILTATAFLKVESALATTKQAEARSRFAALAAVRLAQAALQERLGPDTRVSAPAAIYDDPALSSASSPGADPFEYPLLGAWRSWEGNDHDTRPNSRYAGRPHRPDYATKLRAFDQAAAPKDRFLGWMVSSQMGYGEGAFILPDGTASQPPEPPKVIATRTTVPLVGPATEAQAVRQIHLSPLSFFDGQTPAKSSLGSLGHFCWWVGGENQKVRITIPHTSAAVTGSTALENAQRLGAFGGPDLEAIGYPALLAGPSPLPANQPLSSPTLALVPAASDASRLTAALKNALPRPLAKGGFHDVSLFAEGLLTNTATGGLRKDLSLFTETWDWANALDPERQGKMPLFRLKPAMLPRPSGNPDYDLAFQRPLPDARLPAGLGNRRRHALLYWWADYGSLGGGRPSDLAADGGTNFGGYMGLSSFPPIRSWAYLTDYCLHYRKYVTNVDPRLGGVTTMLPPQPVGAAEAGDLYSYYERIHRHPLVARIQYVFASSAVDNTPAFIAQPVVTLWNPFNVRLTVPSFRIYCNWRSLPVQVACEDGAGYAIRQHVGPYFPGGVNLVVGGGAEITLEPGQTRVFALNSEQLVAVPLGSGGTFNLTPGYVASGRTGWRMTLPGTTTGAGSLRYRLIKNIDEPLVARDGIYYDYYPANYRYSPVRNSFVGTTTAQFRQLYGEDAPYPFQQTLADAAATPRAFGTFAFGLRLSNDGVSQHDGRTGVKTLSKGFLQASPFTTYTEIGHKSAGVLTAYPYASANVADHRTIPVAPQYSKEGSGAAFYSAANGGVQYAGALNPLNAPYDLYFLPMSGFVDSNGPQSNPADNHGGYILTGLDPTAGLSRAVVAELPVKPLQSLAALQGCDLRATNPAPPFHYGLVGNADASPILPPDDTVGRWIDQTGALRSRDEISQSFLQYDDSYCLNHLLFDDWFVSSLAPSPNDWATLRPGPGLEHAWNPAVMGSLKRNWTDFVAGTAPLPNACFAPNAAASWLDLEASGTAGFTGVPAQPVAYQRIAATLRVPGQFNVNSTSVVAWRAVLGNLRASPVPSILPGGTTVATTTANNPLTRMAVSHERAVTSGGASAAVLGFAALNDAQLEQLAVEIVRQVKARGPFLSLSEFVNRRLAPAQPGKVLDPSLDGALGTALRSLEQAGGSLNPAEPAKRVGRTTSKVGDLGGLEQSLPLGDWTGSAAGPMGDYLHPKAAEGSSTFGLPGWPRQADLLGRLAPILSVRDETFVVRAMGSAPVGNGETAKAWCEAVYQRSPEYMDARVPAHEAPLGDQALGSETGSRRVNALLGRRFRLVAFRWLTAKEL